MSFCKQSVSNCRKAWCFGMYVATFFALLLSVNQLWAKPAIQSLEIKGIVLDATTQKPMAGGTIEEKGTLNVVISGEDGSYRITEKENKAVLAYSFVGYEKQEITVGSQTSINVLLQTTVSQMDEVIVVGFGTQKKEYLTGSITQVDAKKITNRPTNNLGQA
ncbi:MAG: carboxypeptidase-like regulatory domain-containing protein, partial [Niabella sp.]